MTTNLEATVLVAAANDRRAETIREALHGKHQLRMAASAREALSVANQLPRPDVIVLDASLCDIDSHTACRELKANFLTADIAVIMVADAADADQAFADGAADVVTDPADAHALRARVGAHARLSQSGSRIKQLGALLQAGSGGRDLAQVHEATILALAALAEHKEDNVHNHLLRTQHYVAALAKELRFNPRFSPELTDENITLMFKAAPLHDIGKVGVPDAILLKPGKLTAEEFNVMKQHTVFGRDAIASVERALGASNTFLRYAREITHAHQEKWDGSGYPQGLAGDAIPVAARLMAVADVYDALISRRRYRPAFTHETAVELIRQGSDEHFDPEVVDAMLAVEEKFRAIATRFRDPD
ncbi:HD-GYP domain-containing protein [Pseudoduganella sp. GCM10020061]|uniref:HD-GYP domain-containing protein n=1 Tax=Pseudoduganella sp. GCM10020061 TaxID=3317345 RepID=UPI00363070E8